MEENTNILNKAVTVFPDDGSITKQIKDIQIKNGTTWRLIPEAYEILGLRSGLDLEIAMYIIFKVAGFPRIVITSEMINKATEHKITRESAEFLIWKEACRSSKEIGVIESPEEYVFRR